MTTPTTHHDHPPAPGRPQRRVAACAVIRDDRDRILLHRRSDNRKWALPGGAIEPSESAAQAIVREVLEETGYRVEVVRLVGIYSHPSHSTMVYPDGNIAVYVALLFECRVTGGSPRINEESLALDWFDPHRLPEPMHTNHLPRIADALAGRPEAFIR